MKTFEEYWKEVMAEFEILQKEHQEKSRKGNVKLQKRRET